MLETCYPPGSLIPLDLDIPRPTPTRAPDAPKVYNLTFAMSRKDK